MARTAVGFAREIQRDLGLAPMDDPFAPANTKLTPPAEFEAGMRAFLPPWQWHLSADDYVEFCWHCPTVRLLTARPRLRVPDANYEYPMWSYNALGGLPAAIDPGMFVAGKTMALTLIDLAAEARPARSREGRMARAYRRRHRRQSHWVPPLLPNDFVAPHDLRWPEYVTTRARRGMVDPDARRGRRCGGAHLMQTGISRRRVEDHRFLIGQGRFVADAMLPGMLHAYVLRSPHAHARIAGIDTATARAMPGVRPC